MVTTINRPEEAEDVLRSLKNGDDAFFNSNPKFRITKIPGGFIYSSDYNGMCFVPELPTPEIKVSTTKAEVSKVEPVGEIKKSVAKTEPKKAIKK